MPFFSKCLISSFQATLSELRDKFKTTIAAIDELEAAFKKVKLAEKLGCSPSELTDKFIEVSSEKLGRVIGKNGATIKQLESEHRVVVNVDSVAGKIQLTGSDMAVGIAVLEIEKICSAIDVDISVATDLLTFLTTKVRIVKISWKVIRVGKFSTFI
jgi:predicted RNA-binding protein YlqC (UPF0109 family)